jgi:hypothetical protein
MLEVLDETFKPECNTYSKVFQDGTPSPNEIIPQSEVFEDNAACTMFPRYQSYRLTQNIWKYLYIFMWKVLTNLETNSHKVWEESHLKKSECHLWDGEILEPIDYSSIIRSTVSLYSRSTDIISVCYDT